MSKELELIRLLIKGANEYEKETGNKNPTVYLSRNNLLVIEQALQRLEKYDDALSGERLTEFGTQLTVNGYTYGMEHKMYYAPEYVVKLYDKLRNVEDIYREVKDNG